MVRFVLTIATCLLVATAVAGAPVPVTGGSLEALEGSSTLVTVVLKSSYARDMNLTVTSVEDDLIRFTDETGASVVYQIADIAELRVQRERVEWSSGIASSPLQREDVAGALRKTSGLAEQLFKSAGHPAIQILASELAGATGSADAVAVLERTALSDNLAIAVAARQSLYILGRNPTGETLKQGLNASDRATKGDAAHLAGLVGLESLQNEVIELVKDPAPRVFEGAAYGSGYYKDRRALPYLLRALNTTDAEKADAAVFALARIGGEDVLREMRTRIQTASGSEWYHAVRVLYLLGDPRGVELLRGELRGSSPYAVQTALMLADDDYWDANVFLRKYLDDNRDASPEAFRLRIAAAALLLSKGYVQAKAYLREVLAIDPNSIYLRGQISDEQAHIAAHAELKVQLCMELAVRADASMLQLLLTSLEDQNPVVSLCAGRAVVAISNPEYKRRLGELYAPFVTL